MSSEKPHRLVLGWAASARSPPLARVCGTLNQPRGSSRRALPHNVPQHWSTAQRGAELAVDGCTGGVDGSVRHACLPPCPSSLLGSPPSLSPSPPSCPTTTASGTIPTNRNTPSAHSPPSPLLQRLRVPVERWQMLQNHIHLHPSGGRVRASWQRSRRR